MAAISSRSRSGGEGGYFGGSGGGCRWGVGGGGEGVDKGEEWGGPTWAGLVGPMASWAAVQQGGASLLFFGFLFFFPFVFSFIISFLFKSFNPFSHFIKICLLHYNYLCNIRQPPNNFILNFENFYCFHQFEF